MVDAEAPKPGTKGEFDVTEDEAALYDRQIRLWGLEAQQRMRNATVALYPLRGIATEVAKNVVLSGIGKLIIADEGDVTWEDLGAGFFFREEDVGKKRVEAAQERIAALNPLVEVMALTSFPSAESGQPLPADWDVVCVTDQTRPRTLAIDELCRKQGKRFYAAGSFGLGGYILADLGDHEYITERIFSPNGPKTRIKKAQSFPPLAEALQQTWAGLNERKMRRLKLNPTFWGLLAAWEFEVRHGRWPSEASQAPELLKTAEDEMKKRGVEPELIGMTEEDFERLAVSTRADFSPTCAILGGVLAQDVLNSLGGREEPIANGAFLDGTTDSFVIHQLGIKPAVVQPMKTAA